MQAEKNRTQRTSIACRGLWPLVGAVLLATGCTAVDVPYAESHLASGQKTARALHHWDVLADDVAMRLADKMRDWPPGEHPVFVSPSGDTRFNQGFRKLLMARLLDRGVALSMQPVAVRLVFETQVVQHIQPASSTLYWSPLVSGVRVARDGVANGWVEKSPRFGETAVEGNDALDSGRPVRTEVLITASLQDNEHYLASTADIYSIEHDDALLYEVVKPPLPVASSAPVKTWRVVSP